LIEKKSKVDTDQNLALIQPKAKVTKSSRPHHTITETVAEEEEMVNLTHNFENLVQRGNISNNKISETLRNAGK
jgi:hypothetical protein